MEREEYGIRKREEGMKIPIFANNGKAIVSGDRNCPFPLFLLPYSLF